MKVLQEPTFEYQYVQSFREGIAAVGKLAMSDMEGTEIGYIDKNGNIVIPIESYYEYWAFQDGRKARDFSEGLVAVNKK